MKLIALVLAVSCAWAQDADRDGIADAEEQRLAVQFLPTYLVSGGDCDVLPTSFEPGNANPRMVQRDGAVYAQVFRPDAVHTEIHYYTLWSRDCGRAGHPLDIEHTAVLIGADGKALYWYAAAHHDTMCDAGNGARAAAIHAENQGPTVWLSNGKHASFLSLALCETRGCGGDGCERMVTMTVPRVINVGEWEHPLNGAVWIRSKKWSFQPKMSTAFPATAIAQMDALEGAGRVNAALVPVRATVMAGGKTVDAVGTGNRHTGSALSTAKEKTEGSLKRATKATGRFLGLGKKPSGR